jgi:UDP-glucose 4-epimerase
VTGGAGFIGSHLCDALITNDYEITVLDNLSTGREYNIAHLTRNINLVRGDIRDKSLVESLVLKNDLIFHLAASVGVENILKNPLESISTNFFGSYVVLNATAKYSKRVVIASTSEIYGKNLKQPLSETDDRVIGSPQKLRWSYSDAKALEEAAAFSLYQSHGLKVTTVRFFNTVGPRQSGEYGMVLPRFVKAAIENKPLKIFGNGLQSRVFCHVHDAVKAMLMVGLNDESIGEVYNIGGLGEITILELAKKVIDLLNSKSEIIFVKYEDAYSLGFEDMERRVPNISKIRDKMGWEPVIQLETIINDIAKSF